MILRLFPLFPLALATGCTFNVEAVSRETHARYDGDGYSTFRAHLGHLPDGLQIHGWDDETLEASASVAGLVAPGDDDLLEDAWLDLARSGSSLSLVLRGIGDRSESIWFEWLDASMPHAIDLDLETDTADITVGGMSGRVRAHTDTGDIEVATSGRLDLESDTGRIRAAGSGGSITTDTGDVTLRLVDAGFGDVRVETDTGDVTVRVPAGAGFVLDVETDTGEIVVEAGGLYLREDDGVHAVVGGGGPRIRIETDTGDVRITEIR
ncbi:DUF4097 family beta strand repeat-containing protein [Vulgatibacter sp.]|uniref:DUF4097 family beta strand repeat-containing protein n=1 Tax=Vulgatibacter sp. TaxID=1971226 RepID=UPI00356395D4